MKEKNSMTKEAAALLLNQMFAAGATPKSASLFLAMNKFDKKDFEEIADMANAFGKKHSDMPAKSLAVLIAAVYACGLEPLFAVNLTDTLGISNARVAEAIEFINTFKKK